MAYKTQKSLGELFSKDSPPPSEKTACAAGVPRSLARRKVAPLKSAAGFLVVDFSFNPVSFNGEAVQILGYPDNVENLARSKVLLSEKIRANLVVAPRLGELAFVEEFRSGRRHYYCRAVLVGSAAKEAPHYNIAVLLERGPSGLIPMSKITEQCNLTRREREVLEYLLHGMSSREIASRMNLSPSTVKAFLRLIMLKMGVSSRSAIIVKVLMTEAW